MKLPYTHIDFLTDVIDKQHKDKELRYLRVIQVNGVRYCVATDMVVLHGVKANMFDMVGLYSASQTPVYNVRQTIDLARFVESITNRAIYSAQKVSSDTYSFGDSQRVRVNPVHTFDSTLFFGEPSHVCAIASDQPIRMVWENEGAFAIIAPMA